MRTLDMDEFSLAILGIEISEKILYTVIVLLAVAVLISIGFAVSKIDESIRGRDDDEWYECDADYEDWEEDEDD